MKIGKLIYDNVATILTRNANSQALRAQVVIFNTNNSTSTTSWLTWNAAAFASGRFPSGTSRTSAQTTGATRNGTVEGQGQRRSSSTANWSASLRPVVVFR